MYLSDIQYLASGKNHANRGQEYCLAESFTASCEPYQVLLMTRAQFGRMNLGRCVTKNYGHIGCAQNVLPQLDVLCSGRHSCTFSVSDAALVRTKPCPQDFASYLEANYECIKVATTPQEWCTSSNNYIHLSESWGYIASITTEETGCGSTQTPWKISVLPGQRLNITMYDFSIAALNRSQPPPPRSSSYPVYCQQYAKVLEAAVSRNTIICGGEQRVKGVYLSTSHEMELQIMNRRTQGKSQYFLFKYEAVGCPNIKPPADTYTRRDGDKLYVICNHTGETSQLTCRANGWDGTLKNCSQAASSVDDTMPPGVGLPPVGISIVIIVGVALVVVVYVAIMIVCVMYLQRRRRRRAAAAMKPMMPGEGPLGDIQMIKHGESTDTLEERVPMLAKPLQFRGSLGCVQLGEYTDMHMRTHLMQARNSIGQDLLCPHAADGLCPIEEQKYIACDCVTTAPRCRTYSRPKESIYDTNLRVHKVKCPTVPNGATSYIELDPKTLHEGANLSRDRDNSNLPGPDVVSGSGRRRGSREGSLDASESENELNRMKEQTL